MTTVHWYHNNMISKELGLLIMEPEPVLPQIIKAREVTPSSFLNCPAFRDYYKNTYVIRSPVDIKLTYDKKSNILSIYPQGQEFYDNYVKHRVNQVGMGDAPLFSLNFSYLFIADKDCLVEQIPVSMHDGAHLNAMRVISGTFNIGRWFRPVEFAFEMIAPEVSIKRGDPLFYVRFIPKDGSKVRLVADKFSSDEEDLVLQCADLKKAQRGLGLEVLYGLAQRLHYKLWFKKNKCPFNWRKK